MGYSDGVQFFRYTIVADYVDFLLETLILEVYCGHITGANNFFLQMKKKSKNAVIILFFNFFLTKLIIVEVMNLKYRHIIPERHCNSVLCTFPLAPPSSCRYC